MNILPPTPQQISIKNFSKKMHITILTIGSRGDVQPYIALCKTLMEDGHQCRIGTHPEFRDWIIGHGIEFREVAGNPADLISLMVENSLFSLKFVRQAVSNFSGWMRDLHETCYKACENTDVIMEAPTVFAGMHIAEKMGVPFFQVFTMPWTRTKAFPHPFATTDTPLGCKTLILLFFT
jgi:sterol 3beta-glucosyltransferase